MFWADKLLQNRKSKELINDAWTPSGIIHMGGLKGPIIHEILFEILQDRNQEVKYTFGFDDFDPIDGLPKDLVDSHSEYMGVPISVAPSPDEKGSFGEYFGNKMRALFQELGIKAEIYLASDYYKKGVYNDSIKFVLDNAEKVRKVYEEMYKKPLKDDWYPLQVVCPNCGKLGTTQVINWNGSIVEFICRPDLVKWAKGCGFSGSISPYDGNAKMPFKVEWAAKWWTFGVTIEGAGKDHASAGGTYDVARKILKDVFKKEPPLKLPYEFFLYDGKKMSSSKGLGLTGQDLLEVLPPELVRFLMIKTEPNHAVEFNPFGTMIIPKLYDDFFAAAQEFDSKEETDASRAFDLALIDKKKKYKPFRFLTLAQWVQMPNMEAEIKKEGLEEWAKYAKVWVEKYAPESEKFLVQKELPEKVSTLSDPQKTFLKSFGDLLNSNLTAEEIQVELYNHAKEVGLPSKDAFAAIYVSLLGKNHGPKAGWIIKSLDLNFVKTRFKEAAKVELKTVNSDLGEITIFSKPDMFSINKNVSEKYSSISIGIATIKNVEIKEKNENLEKEKESLLESLRDLTTEQLGEYPEITSYRKLYREMGIDWHSRRPSPEALLRRVALKKGLYTINTAVDAYNLVVMKHRVSIGAFDLDKIEFPTELRMAAAGEEILLLGDEKPTQYKEGELAYFDKEGGYNIDFNFRDAQRTAVTLDTKNLYINVDGIFDITSQKVEEVLREAVDKIIEYSGGTLEEFGVVTS